MFVTVFLTVSAEGILFFNYNYLWRDLAKTPRAIAKCFPMRALPSKVDWDTSSSPSSENCIAAKFAGVNGAAESAYRLLCKIKARKRIFHSGPAAVTRSKWSDNRCAGPHALLASIGYTTELNRRPNYDLRSDQYRPAIRRYRSQK
jgi:hypothetical protein